MKKVKEKESLIGEKVEVVVGVNKIMSGEKENQGNSRRRKSG